MGSGTGEHRWRSGNSKCVGRYTIDRDVHRQIVLAEPFAAVVHDAVAQLVTPIGCPILSALVAILARGATAIGEWDYGTHAHGWAHATRDMMFYTWVSHRLSGLCHDALPRLGDAWAKGSVPRRRRSR
jgi:hypothetical protein